MHWKIWRKNGSVSHLFSCKMLLKSNNLGGFIWYWKLSLKVRFIDFVNLCESQLKSNQKIFVSYLLDPSLQNFTKLFQDAKFFMSFPQLISYSTRIEVRNCRQTLFTIFKLEISYWEIQIENSQSLPKKVNKSFLLWYFTKTVMQCVQK